MKCRICDNTLKSTDCRCPNCDAIIDDYYDVNHDLTYDLDDEDLKYFLG